MRPDRKDDSKEAEIMADKKAPRDYKQRDDKTIQNILENYNQNETSLVNQLYFTTSHGTTIGSFREDIWRGMFEQIIPEKFVI